LIVPTPSGDGPDPLFSYRRLTGFGPKIGTDHQLVGTYSRVSIREVEPGDIDAAGPALTEVIDNRACEYVDDFLAEAPGVLSHSPADAPRDSHQELETEATGLGGCSGDLGHPGPTTGVNHLRNLDPGELMAKLDHHPGDAFVGDYQVAPPSQGQHRHRILGEGRGNVIEVGHPIDLNEHLGGAAQLVSGDPVKPHIGVNETGLDQ
jgi:hypothetical protein